MNNDLFSLIALLSGERFGGGDALKRAYRAAWNESPDERGNVDFLVQYLKSAGVPGAYLGHVPQPISGALLDWENRVSPKNMKHRTGFRLLK